MIATDLLKYLPDAFQEMRQRALHKNIRLC
jgi:hypothetical protein